MTQPVSKTIAIYAPQNAVGISIMLISEMCWYAAQKMKTTSGKDLRVVVTTLTGQPLTCSTGITLSVDGCLEDLLSADAVFLAGFWGNVDLAMAENRSLMPALITLNNKGVPIAAVSTGTFLLAETGLLDAKIATTYPPSIKTFCERFPSVNLRPNRAITDAGGLYCANGIPAGCDLITSIIELLCGPEIARQTARAFMAGFSRTYSLANMAFDGQKFHSDRQIITAQQTIERSYGDSIQISALAEDLGMSPRNFTRRFRAATNESPNGYLRRVRIEAAKDLMRDGALSLAEISDQVGYHDPSSFLKAFQRVTGQTPGDFRSHLKMVQD